MIKVVLTHEEMEVAANEGVRRRLRNLARGSKPLRGGIKNPTTTSPEVWKCDIEGAAAEVAVAKFTNRYWAGVNQQGGVDVGTTGGVRHTDNPDGHLIVYHDDPDDMMMVLVTGTPPNLRIHGWLPARAAKFPKYHRDKRPPTEFWVPQEDLREFTAEDIRKCLSNSASL